MRRYPTLIAVLALVAAACAPATGDTTTSTTGDTGSGTPGIFASAYLQTFGACDDLLQYYIDQALPLVGPYGLPGGGPYYAERLFAEDAAGVRREGAATTAPASAIAGEGGVDYTGTNTQVAGVDEADIVKTDGRRIFVLVDGQLRIAHPTDDGVAFDGSLRFEDWWPSDMLLHGDTLLLIGQDWSGSGGPVPLAESRIAGPDYGGSGVVRIVEVDVSDVDRPQIARRLFIDGTYVSSRLVDGVARLVLSSAPVGFAWEYPEGDGLRAEREATRRNREIVEGSTLDNWLPYYVLEDDTTGSTREGRALDCTSVLAPKTFSGLNTLSVLTFDLEEGIGSWADAGVVADGSTVYATADHLYVATHPWMDWAVLESEDELREEAKRFRSQIHLFDTSDQGAPAYLASGEVEGFLLNQFAMDEYQGVLRVASTTAPSGWWWSGESESLVTTLEQRDDQLVEIGRVEGLGKGEQIFAVRFLGEVGYVVTFRQTDPLYTIDLSNPTAPRVAGELKIVGYSAYLHPLGDGRILGLGQDATEEGRVKGTQLSLFDVSDPADPRRIDQVTMDGGYSQAETNHHAFTMWNDLVLAPYESWSFSEREGTERFDTGVIAVRVNDDHLTLEKVLRPVETGPVKGEDFDRIQPWKWTPLRTVVIDGRIFTITNGGIAVHDARTLERIAFEEF